MNHLKGLLSQNIERAVYSRPAGSTVWVEHVVWDHTSFHGCSYREVYEEYNDEENTFGRNYPNDELEENIVVFPAKTIVNEGECIMRCQIEN